ncbi:hypothetical protein HA402_004572 [Bradysia odoriphaga]|nr:hypothetical protein HA402_004572 [Bradysia odoriphaga]
MPGALFVVASSADQKLINRLLLHLRDWEYGEEPTWDNFLFITSKNLPETEEACGTTIPPISESDLSNNVWRGKSIADVESFMLSERETVGLNANSFLVLDEQGVKDGTIILFDSLESGDEEVEVKFKKVRVPWDKAYIMWCNLDIANMDFEDFVDDEDCDESGWRNYKDWDEGQEADDSNHIKVKRNNAIAELEKAEKKSN